MIPAYVEALRREILFVGRQLKDEETKRANGDAIKVHTLFFGGGTPSLLSPPQLASVIKALRASFSLTPDCEITLEANPGTITYEALSHLREIGINRLSFGVQSANMEELRMLERTHDFFDVIEAVTSARKAGFTNLNLDLIYGLPEQKMQTWQTTVKRILELHPEHISAYALTIEHGTPFGKWTARGLMPLPDPDLAAEMYEWLSETLEANGYVQYEISNWAKSNPEFFCRHNLQYWRSLPYLGFGAGAHGYANGYRYSNVLRIKTYIERLTTYQSSNHQFSNYPFPLSPAVVNHHRQTLADDMSEYMLNNLRLVRAGVTESDFRSRFGSGLLDVYQNEIEELIHNGLLECSGESYRLTRRGRLLGNRVFLRFLKN